MMTERKFQGATKELRINHDFSKLQQRGHTWAEELYATLVVNGETPPLCYSCHVAL